MTDLCFLIVMIDDLSKPEVSRDISGQIPQLKQTFPSSISKASTYAYVMQVLGINGPA